MLKKVPFSHIVRIAACLIPLIAAAQNLIPNGEGQVGRVFNRVPVWSGNTLVAIEKDLTANPVVHTFDSQGRELQVATVSLPDAKAVFVGGAVSKPDTTLIACGWASDSAGHYGGFISIISPDRQTAKIIKTAPYQPEMITLDSDGTFWTKGEEAVRQPSPGATVIRHFDATGKFIEGFIPQTSLDPIDIFAGGTSTGGLVVSNGRVGWYQARGKNYFEIIGGQVNKYRALPEGAVVTALAITEDGRVFISKRGGPHALYTFDRSNGAWQQLPLPDPNAPTLVGGFDGNLVFHSKDWLSFKIFAVAP